MRTSRKTRKGDMDWLGLESRLREILRDFQKNPKSLTNAHAALYQIDGAIGAYTRRGMELHEPTTDDEADLYHCRLWEWNLYDRNHQQGNK